MAHLVDVVIPMYNRADCVTNIIAELQRQTFKDFRAIFVDDGSVDNTNEVLSRELKNAEFDYTVITKENGGAGSARNAGMRAANAQWIAFVDSDDGLKPQFLEYLYSAAVSTNSDLAVCNLKMYAEGKRVIIEPAEKLEFTSISPAQAMKLFCTKWFGPVCLLMSREMIFTNDLFFDENCIYNEDAPFITKVIATSEKVAYIEQELYLYFTHRGSLHRSPRLDKYLSVIESFSKVEKELLSSEKEAARVFNNMGSARFYIATLRRGAVQMSFKDFSVLEKRINFKKYKDQIKNLLPTQQLAANVLLFSKRLFFVLMKIIFKD